MQAKIENNKLIGATMIPQEIKDIFEKQPEQNFHELMAPVIGLFDQMDRAARDSQLTIEEVVAAVMMLLSKAFANLSQEDREDLYDKIILGLKIIAVIDEGEPND